MDKEFSFELMNGDCLEVLAGLPENRDCLLRAVARIAELEELIEKLVDEGYVIAERFSVKGGSEADLEDWENVIDEYKAIMPEVQE